MDPLSVVAPPMRGAHTWSLPTFERDVFAWLLVFIKLHYPFRINWFQHADSEIKSHNLSSWIPFSIYMGLDLLRVTYLRLVRRNALQERLTVKFKGCRYDVMLLGTGIITPLLSEIIFVTASIQCALKTPVTKIHCFLCENQALLWLVNLWDNNTIDQFDCFSFIWSMIFRVGNVGLFWKLEFFKSVFPC